MLIGSEVRRARVRVWIGLLLGALVGAASVAGAAPPDQAKKAQALFDEALALMKDGRYADACVKLKESDALDPGMDTRFRLAECYESAGLFGSAWVLFIEVADAAKKANRRDRAAQAEGRAEALRPRGPMMTLAVPRDVASLPGLAIERDGEAFAAAQWNVPVPVDPGAQTIVVTADGKKPWQETTRALAGAKIEEHVPALLPDDAAAAPGAPPAAARGGLGGMRIGAIDDSHRVMRILKK